MNDERRAKILIAIANGVWPSVAARAAGYSRRQWDALLEDGELALAVEKAEAVAELELLNHVRVSERPGGTAWVLERRFPSRWSVQLRQRIEEERQELLAALKANIDEVTFKRVVAALQEHAAKTKKSA